MIKDKWHEIKKIIGRQEYIDWLIEWCLTSSGKYFMHFLDESILMMSDDEWTLLCTIPTRWAHESNSPREDVPLYPDTLFWLWDHQSMLLLLNAACLAEKQHIPILMSLVWSGRGSNPRPSALEASTLQKVTTCSSDLKFQHSDKKF